MVCRHDLVRAFKHVGVESLGLRVLVLGARVWIKAGPKCRVSWQYYRPDWSWPYRSKRENPMGSSLGGHGTHGFPYYPLLRYSPWVSP